MSLLLSAAACLAAISFSGSAAAWTSARLQSVDVKVEVAAEGESRVATVARYEVSGGRFHGFDLAPGAGEGLVPEKCHAERDDGRRIPVSFRDLYDGRTRVVLAGDDSIRRGAVAFHLVQRTDLAAEGALRRYEGRARIDWTPIVWDEGTDQMTLGFELPGPSRDAPIAVDPDVARDYRVETDRDSVSLTKYRTVRWYPMRAVIEVDPALFPSLAEAEQPAAEAEEPRKDLAAVGSASVLEPPTAPPPLYVMLLPVLAALAGLLLTVLKTWQLRRTQLELGWPPRFRLLPRTGLAARLLLSLVAAGLGLAAQHFGSLAASVPAFGVSAALWFVSRQQGSLRPRPGGAWRPMTGDDLSRVRDLARAYRARRAMWIDITTFRGAALFGVALLALARCAITVHERWPHASWSAVIAAGVYLTPAFFSHVRSELPVDPTLEGFAALERWRSSLSRLLSSLVPGSSTSFWMREDDKGLIEVRLRAEPAPQGLSGMELAGEVVRAGTTCRMRKAAIMRLVPGTESARELASCPHAAEHHLTPDLQEEVIVLRHRRGRSEGGLAPLRVALSRLGV
ncbi:MAG: hypothetical protein R6V85_16320 [Polyangia bacterium]